MKINEIIEERMHYRGVNQTMVCKECGLIVQNFNAFLKGRRCLAIESLIKVMKHLNMAFSKEGSVFSPNLIEDKVKISLKGSEVKMVTIAKSINVSGSTLSTIVNGKRKMSSKVLYALIDYFGIEVVTIK
jgi:plasmid maintenance system antidote protein VapI